jgi:hypothetical protein
MSRKAQPTFDNSQRDYYLRELNRTLPVNGSNRDQSALNAALGIADPDMPTGGVPADASRIFGGFRDDTNARGRDTTCRNLQHPRGMRDPTATAGCGWWFVQDPTIPSSGAYGSRRGPMSPNLDTQVGAGQWVWDVATAERLEGMKQAARVATCPDIQYSQYPNMGWCVQTQRAIITDGKGNPAFPGAMGGDCAQGSIVTKAENCPRPPPPAPNTPAPPVPSNSVSGLCQQGTGPQSPACLQALSSLWCSPAGLLPQALAGGSYAGTNNNIVAANQYMNQRNFNIHQGIMAGGDVSISDALANAKQLRTLANTNDGSRAVAAAQNLCFGTPFDPCQFNGTDKGPFPAECITNACLAAGWSQKGAQMPANAPAGTWDKFQNWAEVVNYIIWAKQVADKPGMTPNPNDQLTAITNVYGSTVRYPRSGCNNMGIMMTRYFFPALAPALFTENGPITHFLGRYLFKDGFPQKPATTEDQTPAGGFLNEGQRYVTYFTPTQGGTYQFLIGNDDSARMLVDDALLMDWQPCCGNNATPTVQMVAGTSYKLTVDFWNGLGGWIFQVLMALNGGQWSQIPPAQLSTPVDRRLPMIEYDFTNAASDSPAYGSSTSLPDTNSIFQQMYRYMAPIGTLGGKQALLINGPQSVNDALGGNPSGIFNFLGAVQGMRLRAVKSFTMMVYVSSVNATNGLSPTLISFFNLPESVTTSLPSRTLQANFVQPYTNRVNDFSLAVSGSGAVAPMGRAPGASGNVFGNRSQVVAPLGQWYHLAWVWSDDWTSYAIYLNGKLQYDAGLGNSFYDPTLIMEQIRIGCDNHAEGAKWSGGIGWFRAFDYRLSPDLINRDMNNTWSSLS